MSKRSNSRKLAMRMIYQLDVRDSNLTDIFEALETDNYHEETIKLAYQLAKLTHNHLGDIDPIIKEYSIDWELERMNPLDLAILRLGFGELLYHDTPKEVILNEMIELAKTYSAEDSPKFINGILGKYVNNICSPD